MDKLTKGILIGLVLGDGHINKKDNCLQITHSIKQKEYLNYKNDLLSDIFKCKKSNLYHRLDSKHNEFVLTKGSRFFKIIRKMLYIDGEKRITKRVLKYLTPQAIALWIMDDGTHGVNKRNGKIISHSFHLYTYTNLQDTNDIIDAFSTFGVKMYKIKRQLKCGVRYYLKCKTHELLKLSNLVRPYMIPSMLYKILPDPHEQNPSAKDEDIV